MLRRVIDIWEGWVVFILLPALALLVVGDVVLRYGFNMPLRWGADVKELMLLLVVTAGLPATSLAGQHIRVGLLDDRLGAGMRRFAARARHAVTAVIALVVAYATLALSLDMHRYGDRAEMINIPFAAIAALVTISAALSALAEVARALHPLPEGA
jgi:TRAP-type transport system small permease protein